MAIVGAGPAGARAAELLAEMGVEVVGFDRRAPWEKPCGGGLPAAAFRNVPELGEVKGFSRRIQKLRFATLGGETIVVPLREPMYVLSRKALGAWQLLRARAAGAHLVRSDIVEIERYGSGWRLRDEQDRVYRARRLVGADGAASRVRRVAAPRFRPELAPTRVALPKGVPPFPADEALFSFLPDVSGYLWDFPRTDHRSVGIGLTPGSWTRGRVDAAVLGYLENGGAGRVGAMQGAVIGTAMWPERDFPLIGGRGYALLGDAAGLADPATGEGMENALRSAGFLAESYERVGDFSLYPRLARTALLPELRVARLIRRCLYHGSVPEKTIAAALGSRWARRFLRSLVDCGNEHRGPVALTLGMLRPLPEAWRSRVSDLAAA